MSSPGLVVRPIVAAERARFDETLEQEHWLGRGLVGEVMRYVATEDDHWVALLGFGSAALCVRERERLVGWNDAQRYRRLRFVTNNQRFCVLDAYRRPNLASEVLARCLRRVSSDFEARWRHPVVMVETFTDPALHRGTCYQATNFTMLGETSGFGRRSGRFVYHGVTKAYWVRGLVRDAHLLLAADFDPPALFGRRTMPATLDLNQLDLTSLLVALARVPDPRRQRGIRHQVPQIVAIATLATLRGATSLAAIGELSSELPQEALARLSCRISPSSGKRVAPEESTIRRVLRAIDAHEVDVVVNRWLASQVGLGLIDDADALEVDLAVMVADDERASVSAVGTESASTRDDSTRDAPVAIRRAVALDGKALRGARLGDNRHVHLVSVVTHDKQGVTVAQGNVDVKTNEITVFRPLLEQLALRDVVVTADALHTQREHAKFLTNAKRGAHYVFGLKGNQPRLEAAAEDLCKDSEVVFESHDRGHGRVEHRYLSVASIPEELAKSLDMASAAQFIKIYRERCDLGDHLESSETSYYVTDLTADEASPEELAHHVRFHWTIENGSHHVRDTTFDEDRSQVRTGAAPQVLATLRNLAISVLRLLGFTNVAQGTRWMAFDLERGLTLLSS